MSEQDRLTRILSIANREYSQGSPIMTDDDYDKYWFELYDENPNAPVLYHSPIEGADLSTGKLRAHSTPLYGTQKANSTKALANFLTRFKDALLIVQPKFHGCAAVLYKKATTSSLILSGDGTYGKDVSEILKYTHIHPNTNRVEKLRHAESVEIIIRWANWYKNTKKAVHTTVAGYLNRKDLSKETPLYMEIILHRIFLDEARFYFDGDYKILDEFLLNHYIEWQKTYPCDGLMIKVFDEERRVAAGHNGTFYNWSIAWKPPIQLHTTKVKNIEWNISKDGKLIPTVYFNPIEFPDSTVTKATGNNAAWLSTRGIAIGNSIIVGKAGEIIPQIIRVGDRLNSYTEPKECPVCSFPLRREGKHLICEGDGCIAKKIQRLNHFCSKECMDIKGIGPKIAEKLLKEPAIGAILDSYPWYLLCRTETFVKHVRDIIGDKLTKNYLDSIKAIEGRKSIIHLLSGLSLPQLGYRNALAAHKEAQAGKCKVRVSQVARESYAKGIKILVTNSKELKGFKFAPVETNEIKYTITGVLSCNRDDMIDHLSAHGWVFIPHVVKDMSYIILGQNPGVTKRERADHFGIVYIKEENLHMFIKEKDNA
jgi:NAD-dependent DNA ligase